jgi:DNA helicase-2/ATP-dependent DNA helicase PcrA
MEDKILEGLNPRQREAVTALQGPLLIVAGAGTGKTKVITTRIAYTIAREEIPPSSVLALTFSKKASLEMLERTQALLGPHKDELWVSTFHSFCHRVLVDYSHWSDFPARFRLLDKIQAMIFLRKAIGALDLRHVIKASAPGESVAELLRVITRAKDEAVAPHDMARYARTLEDKEKKNIYLETAKVYEFYQERLRESHAMDFADLVLNTLRVLKDKPSLLEELRRRFSYFLVDEFQDTNIAQIELITLLAAGSRNICVVGDDDQGIYRFRGASYASFIRFKESFPDTRVIALTENYRSTKTILKAAAHVIEKNADTRYAPDKILYTHNEKGKAIEIYCCGDYVQEAHCVVKKIRELYESQLERERRFSSIAILYRAHSHKDEIVALLKNTDIPYIVSGSVDLFEQGEIKDIICLLTVLGSREDEINLLAVLTGPLYKIPADELHAAIEYARAHGMTLSAALEDVLSLPVGEDSRQALREFNAVAARIRQHLFRWSTEKVLFESLHATGYLKKLLEAQDPRALTMAHIGRFFSIVNTFCMENKDNTLPEFLEYLKFYIEAGGDAPSGENAYENFDAVRLLTIHQAKGLEFDFCVLIGLTQSRFPPRHKKEFIEFPSALMKERLPQGDVFLQEERRLFYVALTRAKKGLIVTTVKKPSVRPSLFVEELKEGLEAQELRDTEFHDPHAHDIHVCGEGAFYSNIAFLNQRRKIARTIDEVERGGLTPEKFSTLSGALHNQVRELADMAEGFHAKKALYAGLAEYTPDIKNLVLSFTQLDVYITCPLRYKFRYVYAIPSRPRANLQFGKDMHKTLEVFYKALEAGEKPRFELLRDIYEESWTDQGYIEQVQKKVYHRQGLEILRRFYDTNFQDAQTIIKPLHLEKEFLLDIDGVKLRGIIDRIDPIAEERVEIIDYKTGKAKTQRFVDTNLQLGVYALACTRYFELVPEKVSFYYLSTNQKLTSTRTHDDIAAAHNFIVDTASQIMAKQFQATPGFYTCLQCDYRILCPLAKT